MTKREIIVGGVGFGVAVVLAGASYLIFAHQPKKVSAVAAQTVGNHQIVLGQDGTAADDELSVSSASNLGQLGGQSGQTTQGGSPANGGTSSTNAVDPATFKQYEKYKNDQSGLFGDIQKGDGAELTVGKKATVVYKGWLTDGTLFDESHTGADGKLQAFQFIEGNHEVISGWEQTMLGMKKGGTRLLIIPPAAGYGNQQQGGIPPDSVLVFEVQLVDVQ